MESNYQFGEDDFLACCGSCKFAKQMAMASPFSSLEEAVDAARRIWFNEVDVNGWLEAFAAHPQIGQAPQSYTFKSQTSAQWSKGEQSTASATATSSSSQELSQWNSQYRQKFGFIFIICASGRSADEILTEVKKRYPNRPIVEFEIAAQEQMKITELRLAKLFSAKPKISLTSDTFNPVIVKKAEERVGVIGAHLASVLEGKPSQIPTRSRPPITTHVLDVSRGSPAAGIDVRLEWWNGTQARPSFGEADAKGWILEGFSSTDKDGRSGQLMKMADALNPGIYRISFDTGKYCPSGFFPFVSIVFQITESQKWEHFHVPLLLSPFSFTTYRGS